jgi:hypothetical protein
MASENEKPSHIFDQSPRATQVRFEEKVILDDAERKEKQRAATEQPKVSTTGASRQNIPEESFDTTKRLDRN